MCLNYPTFRGAVQPRCATIACMEPSPAFWSALDALAASSPLVVDRPHGTAHPRYPELIYPHDYGYLADIPAADGGGLDVWLGSLPGRQITGILCTVDSVKRDVEIKLLLGCTPAEMEEIRQFQTSGSMAAILVVRPPEGAA